MNINGKWMRFTLRIAGMICLLTVVSSVVLGLAGDLDTTFGTNGIVLTDFSPNARNEWWKSVEFQSTGKIIAAGGMEIAGEYGYSKYNAFLRRFNVDGSTDQSFGNNGQVEFGVQEYIRIFDLVIQSDDNIIIVFNQLSGGANQEHAIIRRYTPNGTIDSTFGNDGDIVTSLWGNPAKLLLQPDGKLLVLLATRSNPLMGVLQRFNIDGSPDLSFGNSGSASLDVYDTRYVGFALVMQPDGKVVVSVNGYSGFHLIRFHANGTPDTSFGLNGIAYGIDDFHNLAYVLAVQADGKLIAVTAENDRPNFSVQRFQANGQLDTSFAANGELLLNQQIVGGITFQPDGKIVLAGFDQVSSHHVRAMLLRLTPNGHPDATFGTCGVSKITTGEYSIFYDVTRDKDNNIIAFGDYSPILNRSDAMIARFDTEPAQVNTGNCEQSFLELLSPLNGAVLTDPEPTLTWTTYKTSSTYNLNIRNSFNEVVLNKTFNTGDVCTGVNCSFDLSSIGLGLENLEEYEWRIRAKGPYGKHNSAAYTFSTNFAVPGPFTLVSPQPDAVVSTNSPVFVWTESENASEYRFRLTNAFDEPVIKIKLTATSQPSLMDICLGGQCTLNSAALGVTLEHDEEYEWKIVARNGFGKAKVPKSSFTTVLPLPEAFTLISPANGVSINTITPLLSWTPSRGATEYRIRIKDDTTGETVFKANNISPEINCTVDTCSLDTTGMPFKGILENGEDYLWFVQARNAYGKAKSPKWVFPVRLSIGLPGFSLQQ